VKLTSDWSNRLRESPSDGPMIHAVPQRVRFHSEFSGPVRKNHSSACVSNPAIGAFVSSLLLRCCPFAIGFPAVVFAFCALSTRVVKIVLLPLNGVTSRSSAHVSKESLIRSSPRETDRDSSGSVFFVTGAISIEASLLHRLPDGVFALPFAVCSVPVANRSLPVASARFSEALSEVAVVDDYFIATGALAEPQVDVVLPADALDCSQPPKHIVFVYSGSHRRPLPRFAVTTAGRLAASSRSLLSGEYHA